LEATTIISAAAWINYQVADDFYRTANDKMPSKLQILLPIKERSLS
jgi:hypothetical protein